MILQAQQAFTLRHPADEAAALAFVRNPGHALSRLAFLRDLQATGQQVQGELVVVFPVIGEVTLPFRSEIQATPSGAQLLPVLLSGERAWVEVQGDAALQPESQVHFDFVFRAHIDVPEAEGWGGAAFEKMVRAAAARTLERIAAALPKGLEEAMLVSPNE